MSRFNVSQCSDSQLEANLAAVAARDHLTTADLLAHLAELDSRRIYAARGFESPQLYCVRRLRYSESAAEKRVRAARVAREYPALFAMVADGRMSVSTVLVLGPALTRGNHTELIEAAAGRSRGEIEQLLAERFPRTEMLEWGTAGCAPTPEPRASDASEEQMSNASDSQHVEFAAPGRAVPCVGEKVVLAETRPLSSEAVALQVTISRATQSKLLRAKDLLAHTAAAGATADVLDRALDALLAQLEKGVAAKTDAPRMPRCTKRARTLPAHVRRAVWERDGGRCAFVSDDGHRCECTRGLQFDHIVPIARGGESTVGNVRLLCRTHNQHVAEKLFGLRFMEAKREAAKAERDRTTTAESDDLRQALRTLRFGREEIARGEAAAGVLPVGATLEARVRAALAVLQPRGSRKVAAPVSPDPPGNCDPGRVLQTRLETPLAQPYLFMNREPEVTAPCQPQGTGRASTRSC